MERIGKFVSDHHLHDGSSVVDLAVFSDLYTVRRAALSRSTLGLAYVGKPESAIIVNSLMPHHVQRAALAHEASHLLLGHPPCLYLCTVSSWAASRYEMQASIAAAELLICKDKLHWLARQGLTMRELESEFDVPPALLELRLSQLRAAA